MSRQSSRCRQSLDLYSGKKQVPCSYVRSSSIQFHFEHCQAARWCFHCIFTAWRTRFWGFHQGNLVDCYLTEEYVHLSSCSDFVVTEHGLFCQDPLLALRLHSRLPVPDVLEDLFLPWIPLSYASSTCSDFFFFFFWWRGQQNGGAMGQCSSSTEFPQAMCTTQSVLYNATFKA